MGNEIKPMNKKELIKRIEEFKPKYIYQRYDGKINKYEVVNDNYLVETKTGMSFDFRRHLMLGKVSENLIDLIECADVVKVLDNGSGSEDKIDIYDKRMLEAVKEDIVNNNYELLEIYTKEMIESISYTVTKM